jgi:hypothetical protein
MPKLRNSRFTYSNVAATLALVVALGGSGYAVVAGSVRSDDIHKNAVKSKHIAPNEATGSDVNEKSLKGIGSGVLGGEWDTITSPIANQDGGNALEAMGVSDDTNPPHVLTPTKIKIVDLYVKLLDEQTQGTRTFHVQADGLGIDGVGKALCTIEAGKSSCRSNKTETIPAGKRFRFWVNYNDNAGPDTVAYFGYRIVTP